jgi:hypothetical protein
MVFYLISYICMVYSLANFVISLPRGGQQPCRSQINNAGCSTRFKIT